jgi:hypothetical protein
MPNVQGTDIDSFEIQAACPRVFMLNLDLGRPLVAAKFQEQSGNGESS